MRVKIWLTALVVLVVALVVFIPSTAGATYKWKHLGAAPLITGGIGDKLGLQEKYTAYRADIAQGTKLAQPNWDVSQLMDSSESVIRSGQTRPVTYQPGKQFEWMVFKPGGKVGAERDVVWEGVKPGEPLEGYEFDVRYGDMELTFFVAAKCGNFGLIEKKQIPKVEAPAPPATSPPSQSYPAPLMYSRPPIPADVCPNIEGIQTVVPEGLVMDEYGNCVIPQQYCTQYQQSAPPPTPAPSIDYPPTILPYPFLGLAVGIPTVALIQTMPFFFNWGGGYYDDYGYYGGGRYRGDYRNDYGYRDDYYGGGRRDQRHHGHQHERQIRPPEVHTRGPRPEQSTVRPPTVRTVPPRAGTQSAQSNFSNSGARTSSVNPPRIGGQQPARQQPARDRRMFSSVASRVSSGARTFSSPPRSYSAPARSGGQRSHHR